MPHFYKEFRQPTALGRAPFLFAAGSAAAIFAASTLGHANALETGHPAEAAFAAGNALPILADGSFWNSLPQWPNVSAAAPFVLGGLGLTAIWALTAWSFVRILRGRSWTAVGSWTLGLSALPLLAITVLCSGLIPLILPKMATGLGAALVSLVLSAGIALVFATVDLVSPVLPKQKVRRLRRDRQRPFALRSVPDIVTMHVETYRPQRRSA